jgi:O-antigen/teichoic acid export membrane protein
LKIKSATNESKIQKTGFSTSKLLVKNTILNLLGMGLPLLVGIIAIPFAVKGLGKEGFGVLAIAWVILGYFGLFDFGLSRATTKFVSEMLGRGDVESLPSIIWTAVIVSFVLGIIGLIVLCAITPYLVETLLKIPYGLVHQAKLSFYILASSIPIILCSSSLRGVLEAAQRFDLVNLIIIPASMMSFIFPGLSFPFHLNLSTVVFLIVLSRIAAALAYLFFCLKVFPIIKIKPKISIKNIKMMISYGGWISITNIVSPLLVYMDRFFIGSLISMASVAFYTVPYEMLVRLRLFPGAIMRAIFPEFSALSACSSSERMEMLFVRSVEYILIIIGPLVVLLFTYAPSILQVWMGAEFVKNSLDVFRVLAIGVFVNSIAFIPFNLLQGVGRPDLPAKFHLVELFFYIALLWLLIQGFGIKGVAWAWSLRVIIDAILLFGAVIKMYPRISAQLKPKKNRITFIIIWILLLWVALFCSNAIFANMISKIFSLSLILLIFSIAAWKYLFNESEKQLVISIRAKLAKYALKQGV